MLAGCKGSLGNIHAVGSNSLETTYIVFKLPYLEQDVRQITSLNETWKILWNWYTIKEKSRYLQRYVVTIKSSRSIFNYTVQLGFFPGFETFLHTFVLICVSCFKAFNIYQKCTRSFNECQITVRGIHKWSHNSDIYMPHCWVHLSFNSGQGKG